MDILIRKYGNLIDVSPDGVNPLPPDLISLLDAPLSYTYKKLLRGAEAWNPVTGQRQNVRLEHRKLYRVDQGRLATGAGYIRKITRTLESNAHRVRVVDITPPHVRPDRFTCYPAAIENIIRFRARQDECVAIMDQVQGGIVHAPTGFGKTTLIGAMALRYPKARIDVVVKQVTVAQRIVRQLTRWLPDVGQIGGNKDRPGRVCVVTADSLHKVDGDADFLFADEVHQLVTDNYSEKLSERYRFSRNFGLSATPFARLDGSHARLECLFGDVIFHMTYQEAVALGLVVQIHVNWLQCRLDKNPVAGKKDPTAKKRWGVWRNQARNIMFADAVRQYPPDTQVIVLVESVEHAVYMWQGLKEFALCYGSMDASDYHEYIKTRLLPQNFIDVSPEVRYNMQVAFERGELKKVIATDVWSTGVDFEQLQVIARADGRDSETIDTQAGGRPARIFEGQEATETKAAVPRKEYGELIDSIDYFDTSMQRKSRGRFLTYKGLGWEQNWPTGKSQFEQMQLDLNNRNVV